MKFFVLFIAFIIFAGCTGDQQAKEKTSTVPVQQPQSPQPQPNPQPTSGDNGLATLQDSDNFIVATNNNQVSKDILSEFEDVAKTLREKTGKKIIITDASRSLNTQASIFYDKCLATEDRICSDPVCDITKSALFSRDENGGYVPKGALKNVDISDRNKVIDILVANGKPENCAHTSNVAVDMWCEGTRGRIVNVSCEEELTNAMIAKGFCRLDSEPWHFEWNAKHVSGGCTQDMGLKYKVKDASADGGYKIIDPKVDEETGRECLVWDYASHSCKLVKPEEKTVAETWSGAWAGTLTFTNNCPSTASCRYVGKPGAITIELTQKDDNKVEGMLYFNTELFDAQELSNSNGGGCPTLSSVVPGESEITGNIESSGLTLIDVGDDVWKLSLTADNRLEGTVSSDDPNCLGMKSDNVALDKK